MDKNNLFRKDIIEFVSRYGPEYKNINNGLSYDEIACKEKKVRILTLTLYSNKGEVLIRKKEKELGEHYEWNYIPPDSIIKSLYKAVCK